MHANVSDGRSDGSDELRRQEITPGCSTSQCVNRDHVERIITVKSQLQPADQPVVNWTLLARSFTTLKRKPTWSILRYCHTTVRQIQ